MGVRRRTSPAHPRARDELTDGEVAAIRQLMVDAFGTDRGARSRTMTGRTPIGGRHFVLDLDGEIVTHASVVERELHIDGRPLGRATSRRSPPRPPMTVEGTGHRSWRPSRRTSATRFELGGARAPAVTTSTSVSAGRRGRGRPSFAVRTARSGRPRRRATSWCCGRPTSPPFELDSAISCEWRIGDVW